MFGPCLVVSKFTVASLFFSHIDVLKRFALLWLQIMTNFHKQSTQSEIHKMHTHYNSIEYALLSAEIEFLHRDMC